MYLEEFSPTKTATVGDDVDPAPLGTALLPED